MTSRTGLRTIGRMFHVYLLVSKDRHVGSADDSSDRAMDMESAG